jgi:hypothetical protein
MLRNSVLGDSVASEMDGLLNSEQYSKLFAPQEIAKRAIEKATSHDGECKCKEECFCKKEDGKCKCCADAKKEVKVSKLFESLNKISAELDDLGFVRSSLTALQAAESIVSEAAGDILQDLGLESEDTDDVEEAFGRNPSLEEDLRDELLKDPDIEVSDSTFGGFEEEIDENLSESLEGPDLDMDVDLEEYEDIDPELARYLSESEAANEDLMPVEFSADDEEFPSREEMLNDIFEEEDLEHDLELEEEFGDMSYADDEDMEDEACAEDCSYADDEEDEEMMEADAELDAWLSKYADEDSDLDFSKLIEESEEEDEDEDQD